MEHVHVIETTCKGVFTSIPALKKDNEDYRLKVIPLENDMLYLRQSHDKLVSLLVKNTTEQASTNAKVEIMYNKLNEANYTTSASHPCVFPVEETHDMESMKIDL